MASSPERISSGASATVAAARRPMASLILASTSAGPAGWKITSSAPPSGPIPREAALGHDREERAVQAGRLQQAADALGVHELAAGVYQHGIGGRRLHQGG